MIFRYINLSRVRVPLRTIPNEQRVDRVHVPTGVDLLAVDPVFDQCNL